MALIKGKVCKNKSLKIKTPLLGWFESYKNHKNKKKIIFLIILLVVTHEDDNIIIEKLNTDYLEIVSVIKFKNIYALQFHPEKSSSNGFKIIDQILNEKF